MDGWGSADILLNQHDRAIQLLLETPSNTDNFRADAFKACLLAALRTPDSLENTVRAGTGPGRRSREEGV